MGLKYSKMPPDAAEHLVLNAGILVSGFNPSTGEYESILGATSGGIQFQANPTYVDFGEDIDNCPPNTKQMKRISYYDPSMSGTFLTCTPERIAQLLGAAVVSDIKVVPRAQLVDADFDDLTWIGDYSDVNTGADAGFLAVTLYNALNTTGFQIQSGKDAKGTMAFEFHGHYDIDDEDQTPPFEIYCKGGTDTTTFPAIHLTRHTIQMHTDDTATLTASVKPIDSTVTWTSGSSSVATVSNGIVTAEGTGSTIITAAITVGGVTYNDTCTVIVEA